jgi:hypothetical protein
LSTVIARPVSTIARGRVNLTLTLSQHQPTHEHERDRVLKDGEPEWLLVRSTRRGAQWSGPRSCLRIWSRRSEDGGRAAVEAVKLFLVTVEEALPQVEGARRVEKKITESALKMAEQLIHTQSEFLQKVVDSAGKSLSRSEEEK